MTLVNFRRAICPFSATLLLQYAGLLFRASASKLQREFHRALFSHSSSPGRPRSETHREERRGKRKEQEGRPFLVQLGFPTPFETIYRMLRLISPRSPFLLFFSPLHFLVLHIPTHTLRSTLGRIAERTPLQNFLTLRWYKYLQPRRRASRGLS